MQTVIQTTYNNNKENNPFAILNCDAYSYLTPYYMRFIHMYTIMGLVSYCTVLLLPIISITLASLLN